MQRCGEFKPPHAGLTESVSVHGVARTETEPSHRDTCPAPPGCGGTRCARGRAAREREAASTQREFERCCQQQRAQPEPGCHPDLSQGCSQRWCHREDVEPVDDRKRSSVPRGVSSMSVAVPTRPACIWHSLFEMSSCLARRGREHIPISILRTSTVLVLQGAEAKLASTHGRISQSKFNISQGMDCRTPGQLQSAHRGSEHVPACMIVQIRACPWREPEN